MKKFSDIEILIILFLIAFVVLYFFLLLTYGDKTITEVPSWVFWLLNN